MIAEAAFSPNPATPCGVHVDGSGGYSATGQRTPFAVIEEPTRGGEGAKWSTGPAACPSRGLAGLVPSDYSYRNIGEITNRGVELSAQRRRRAWNWFFNVSWQDEPEIRGEGVDPAEVNIPPEWRGNLGVGYDMRKWFWSANVNYQDEAYWADVLFARGNSDAFTQVNVALVCDRVRPPAASRMSAG